VGASKVYFKQGCFEEDEILFEAGDNEYNGARIPTIGIVHPKLWVIFSSTKNFGK
jgi:hypothetical protein